MPHRALLGRRASLRIVEFSPHGAHLAVPASARGNRPDATLLLLGSDIPTDAHEGMVVDVFVYLDSKDRPIATTATPKLSLGEVTFLTVADLTPIGAFVAWGLPKDLLVPFAEQPSPPRVGERHPVGLSIDNTGRLVGTMRVSKMLKQPPTCQLNDWVAGEAWRYDPNIGVFVIIERHCVGLLPAAEPQALQRGERARFRVSRVLPDGKVELSLRKPAAEAVVAEAEQILHALRQAAPPRVNDRSSPRQIHALFGISKKAFKRAVGRLLKRRLVAFHADGYLVAVMDPPPPTRRPPR